LTSPTQSILDPDSSIKYRNKEFDKMSDIAGEEIDVLVEDDVAKAILLASLPMSLRARATFTCIGSASALARQLVALYVRKERKPVMAVFDGGQRAKASDNMSHAAKMAESTNSDFSQWYTDCVCYLPDDTWPEAWLLMSAADAPDSLAVDLGCGVDDLKTVIARGLQAGKHNEFHDKQRNSSEK